MFLEKFNEFSNAFTLSLADMLTIFAALFSMAVFIVGYCFRLRKSEFYNISINNFDLGINDIMKYSTILYLISTILSIIVLSSIFHTFRTGKLVIFFILVIISSFIISNSCVNVCFVNTKEIEKDSKEYNKKNICIFILIVIMKLIICFLLSTFLYIEGVQRDVNKYTTSQSSKAEEVLLNEEERSNFDFMFETLNEKSQNSNTIGIKDRIKYFYNPDLFIESDNVGIKKNQYFEKFKEYLVENNYNDILYEVIKSMFLIKSITVFYIILFAVSLVILGLTILDILNYAFNPEKNNRYDIIEIKGEKYVVLNNKDGTFLCVKYRVENDDKLILLCEEYTTYTPDNYKLTEAFFKEKNIEGQNKNIKRFKIIDLLEINVRVICQKLCEIFRGNKESSDK